MKVKDIVQLIESIAPIAYQESYDNSGLQVGSPEQDIKSILLCLDSTEAVIDEAIVKGCNMVLAHHPLIFKGLKKITGKNDVERTIIKAIKHNIVIYAAHTNLDNVFQKGVNQKFAQKLGLKDLQILLAKDSQLVKLQIYTPSEHSNSVEQALFAAGAGNIGKYTECSFTTKGIGGFKPGNDSKPFFGELGKRETLEENKIEAIAPAFLAQNIINRVKLAHPYEEMAYEIVPLANIHQEIGSGMLGILEQEMDAESFLIHLKKSLNLDVIKYTPIQKKIRKVAVCGGSGSFLLHSAIRSGADAYISSDVKYHEFFDALGSLMFCDIGHYESEISTLELFYEVIQEKFPNFAVHFCETSTNPIHYHK